MEGISHETIVNFFENETEDDFKKIFCWCLSVQLCNKIYFVSGDDD